MAEIKNLKRVANRIKKAIKNKEKIILYGDADLDGTASVVILEEAIQNLGGKVAIVYFVDREKEGYGINKMALSYLKKEAPSLLITLDLGITNFEEAKLAKKLGFEIIIIDHHTIVNRVPEASIVVDPKQPGDGYHFKELANTGIVYRLANILFEDELPEFLDDSFLELTALATMADMMPREQENKVYIEQGIKSLKFSSRLGLKTFFEMDSLKILGMKEIVQKIISSLNISDIKNHITETYLLFISKNKKQVKILAKKLLEKTKERQIKVKEITRQVGERITKKPECPIIFEGDYGWLNILVGAVASRLCNKYKKPCFIFNKTKERSTGAVRMPKGIDAVKAMSACSKLLITFGGHPPAAGFSIKNENLEKFNQCLIKYFENL